MTEISAEAIERRAKALAEREGKTWHLVEFRQRPGWVGKIEGPPKPVEGAERQQYLDRARAELCKEAGDA